MFKKIGKKLVQGAKEELSEKPVIDMDIIKLVLEVGIGLLVIFAGGKSDKSSSTPTVIINNYISKGDNE